MKKVKLMQYASAIRRPATQREQLKTLGLGRKLNRVSELPDSPSVRALAKKLAHMVRIIEGE